MNRSGSEDLFARAGRVIPGGVNSPVRAFKSVHDVPFYVARGKGAYLYDVDRNAYLDYVMSWGALIFGHADEGLLGEIGKALQDGTSFGACHPYEVEMAELLTAIFPSIDKVRLTSSGTEAVMSAIRLARGFTGRQGIVKFKGCYHGHVDSLLVKAGSGLATFGVPDSLGVPDDLARHTAVADFNNIESVTSILDKNRDIACIIVEPIMGNMGVILPEEGFLKGLREACTKTGALLIFDEVITGFRVAFGGAQHLYEVSPDLTCLGKIIGGGFPIGAFGGRGEIMDALAPLGSVYQAGTLSGNPIAVRAGIYTLGYLRDHQAVYSEIENRADGLSREIMSLASREGIAYRINAVCGMFTGFFSPVEVRDYDSALKADRTAYETFFKAMLQEGIFFAPSPFEAAFVSTAHGDEEIEKTIGGYKKAFGLLKEGCRVS
jgi:glutamate-1-semialdehyde 2,1-aminomutase